LLNELKDAKNQLNETRKPMQDMKGKFRHRKPEKMQIVALEMKNSLSQIKLKLKLNKNKTTY
jgi:hypothetical protein